MMEMVAEEMRVLYVALTRAREKIFLVGTLKDGGKTCKRWGRHTAHPHCLLPDYERARAKGYLDWVGSAIVRHRDGKPIRERAEVHDPAGDMYADPSRWRVEITKDAELTDVPQAEQSNQKEVENKVRNFQPVPFDSAWRRHVNERLEWAYDHRHA